MQMFLLSGIRVAYFITVLIFKQIGKDETAESLTFRVEGSSGMKHMTKNNFCGVSDICGNEDSSVNCL